MIIRMKTNGAIRVRIATIGSPAVAMQTRKLICSCWIAENHAAYTRCLAAVGWKLVYKAIRI